MVELVVEEVVEVVPITGTLGVTVGVAVTLAGMAVVLGSRVGIAKGHALSSFSRLRSSKNGHKPFAVVDADDVDAGGTTAARAAMCLPL